MDVITRDLQRPHPWCLLYADDVVLCEETRDNLEDSINTWKNRLAQYGLRINPRKTEYMQYFQQTADQVKLDGEAIPKCRSFRYLGSTVESVMMGNRLRRLPGV